MKIVEDFGITPAGTAVVDDDIFPIAESIFGGIDLGAGGFDEDQLTDCGFGRRGRRGRDSFGWGGCGGDFSWGGRGRGAKAQEVA